MKVFLLFLLSTLPFFSSLVYFLPSDPPSWVLPLLLTTKMFLFVSPFLFSLYLLGENPKRFLRVVKSKNNFRTWRVGILIGLGMGASVAIGFELLPREIQALGLERIAKKISVLKIKEYFFFYGIFLSFIHSLLEEFYWRYFIYGAWKKNFSHKLSPIHIHLISAFAFTLHHFTVTVHYFDLWLGLLLGMGVFIAGLCWTFIYEKEKSLLAAWISHIIADLALIYIGFKAIT